MLAMGAPARMRSAAWSRHHRGPPGPLAGSPNITWRWYAVQPASAHRAARHVSAALSGTMRSAYTVVSTRRRRRFPRMFSR